jgi:hypothetical protein
MRFIAPNGEAIFALGVNYPLKVAAFDPALSGCFSPARDTLGIKAPKIGD